MGRAGERRRGWRAARLEAWSRPVRVSDRQAGAAAAVLRGSNLGLHDPRGGNL